VVLADGAPAMAVPRAEAVAALAAELGWDQEKIDGVLSHFTLGPRASLLKPPAPFERSDVVPWRYGRRLSLTRRPLVARGDELLYGYRAVDATGDLLVREIQSARLKVESREMGEAITALRQRSDERFNDDVAEMYRAVPGLLVAVRVDQFGTLRLARSPAEPLGDVDVLVADPGQRLVEAIDTKNLAVARTPIEIARELRRTFKADDTDKESAVDRHLKRAAWLREHLGEVLAWLGVDAGDGAADAWRVEPSIVVNTEVPAAFLEDLPMRVVDVALLEEELAVRAGGSKRR
jgi:hypothetical protein